MIICKQEYFYILENNEFLHFAKVLLVHSSKDKASVDWWENENKTKDDSIPKVYINNLTMSARLENYRKFVKNLPKMQIETSHCQYSIPRIQEYFSHSKYWKNTNKSEERRKFLDFFSLKKCFFSEKRKHQLQNCTPCQSTCLNASIMHSSSFDANTDLIESAQEWQEWQQIQQTHQSKQHQKSSTP